MAQCMNPIYLIDQGTHAACGRCFNCVARRASSWSFRLFYHGLNSDMAYFVTLTYDEAHVPRTPNGYKTLVRSKRRRPKGVKWPPHPHDEFAIQGFFKRLRFAAFGSSQSKLKYYVCGEYGGHSFRPHYHALIFDLPLEFLVGADAKFVALEQLSLDGKVPYRCPSWSFGHITVGEVNGASIGYTLKYMQKPHRIPLHRNDDRCPEFANMSKGLGLSYLTANMVAWHKADLTERMYCSMDGKKICMPRYYKDKMYTDEERQEILIAFLKKPRNITKLTREQAKDLSDFKFNSLISKTGKL